MRRMGWILVCVLLAACGGNSPAASRKPSVVASFYPLAFMAGEIGGRLVQVHNLTPPGVEPHDLELKPDQVSLIGQADLMLYLGRGFQPSVREAVVGGNTNAYDLLAAQKPPDAGQKDVDPHVWLDPRRMIEMAAAVRQRMQAIDRRNAAVYMDNAKNLTAELAALDREFKAGLADCKRRAIVTSHEAFAYLARAYGLEQIGVSGLDPEAEPSPRRLRRAAEFIRRTGATTVYFESLVSPAVARTLAEETGVKTAKLDPIETAPSKGDYFAAMRENLAALRKGLECR